MILFCLSLFTLSQYASPPVFYMYILNYSTSKLVTSVEFTKAPSLSNLINFHGCFSFFSFVRMMRIMRKWDSLGAVGNIYSIPVFARTEASTEANPQMEVKL